MADTNATSTDFSVSVACGGGNGYDGRIGLRVSSIFVIGFGSFLGMSFDSILREGFLTLFLQELYFQSTFQERNA
jgi:hypothetical protein